MHVPLESGSLIMIINVPLRQLLPFQRYASFNISYAPGRYASGLSKGTTPDLYLGYGKYGHVVCHWIRLHELSRNLHVSSPRSLSLSIYAFISAHTNTHNIWAKNVVQSNMVMLYLKWMVSSSWVFFPIGSPHQLIPIKGFKGYTVFPCVGHILHIMVLKIASWFLKIVSRFLISWWSTPYFITFLIILISFP